MAWLHNLSMMINTMNTRVHIFISGRVQGVFFRSRTTIKANKIGVAGWVKNLPDGRVEAVFEGDKETVEEMISFCKKGPPRTLVKNTEIRQEACTGKYKDFTIAY